MFYDFMLVLTIVVASFYAGVVYGKTKETYEIWKALDSVKEWHPEYKDVIEMIDDKYGMDRYC